MNAYSLAKALMGNMTQDDREAVVMNVDRLRALALGSIGPSRESHLNSLGTSLIAFKHANRAEYYLRAVKDLGAALAWRKVKNRGAVARTAIGEWAVDMCPACLGAREIGDSNGVMRPCLPCNKSGKRRYGEDERRGIPGKAMSEAHSLISLAVSAAVRGASRRLR